MAEAEKKLQEVPFSGESLAKYTGERLGYGELQSFFHRIGLDQARDLPSTALGAFEASPLDIAEAYSLFVNGGAIPRTRILDQIHLPEHQGSHDDQTARWEILLETRPASEQLVSARAAAMARSCLLYTSDAADE